MDEPLMKIGEIAAFFNVSVKALRHYEKKGLLTPAHVDPSTNYRYYAPDQVHRLNTVIELKALGFSLGEIQALLRGDVGADDLLAALARKRAAWQDAMSLAQYRVESLQAIEERVAQSHDAQHMRRMTEQERAMLLVRMVCVEDIRTQSALSEALWL